MEKYYTLITGATSDLGTATAEVLSDKYNLILQGRNQEKLNKLKEKLNNPNNHLIFTFDLSDLSLFSEQFYEFLQHNHAIIDNVIHIAGILEVMPVRMANSKSLAHSFNINLFSFVDIMNILLKKEYRTFIKNVIAISTVACHGLFGRGNVAYVSSKSSLEGYIKVLAAELAPNIRVNCIAPGALKVNKVNIEDEYIAKINKSHPMGLGTPQDIANMIEYLISDKSRWITGQTFIVDGGYSVNTI